MTNRRSKKRSLRRQNRELVKNLNREQSLAEASKSVPETKTGACYVGDVVAQERRSTGENGKWGKCIGNEARERHFSSRDAGDIITLLFYNGLQGVAEYIFSYLDRDSLLAVERVSKEYRQVVIEGLLWKKMLERSCEEDYLIQLICSKDCLDSFVFQQKSPDVCFEFYRDLYFHITKSRQQLSQNWRGEMAARGRFSFRVRDINFELPPPHGEVVCMHYSSESVVLGYSGGRIKILEASSLKQMKKLKQRGGITCLKSDGMVLITASGDHNLNLWDLSAGEQVQTLIGHSDFVTDIQFNETWVISSSKDKTLKVWCRINKLKCIPAITLVNDLLQGFNCLDFNNQYVVAGSDDSSIRIWKADSWCKFGYLYGHEDSVTCIQMNNKYVVSGSLDKKVRVWYTSFGNCVRVLDHGWAVLSLRLNDNYLVTGDKGKITVWDFQAVLNPDALTEEDIFLQSIYHQRGSIRSLFMDEFKIVSLSDDNTVMFSEFLTFGDQ